VPTLLLVMAKSLSGSVKFVILVCILSVLVSSNVALIVETSHFFRSFNATYGRVGKAASEEVVLHLIKAQCIPVLTYGPDVCPLTVSDRNSLEFTVTRCLMKVFATCSKEIIDDCGVYFGFPTVKQLVIRSKSAFLTKYAEHSNILCKMCSDAAVAKLLTLV